RTGLHTADPLRQDTTTGCAGRACAACCCPQGRDSLSTRPGAQCGEVTAPGRSPAMWPIPRRRVPKNLRVAGSQNQIHPLACELRHTQLREGWRVTPRGATRNRSTPSTEVALQGMLRVLTCPQ